MTSSENLKQPESVEQLIETTHGDIEKILAARPLQYVEEEVSFKGTQKAKDGKDLPIFKTEPYLVVGAIDGFDLLNEAPDIADLFGVTPLSYVEVGYSRAGFIEGKDNPSRTRYYPAQTVFTVTTPGRDTIKSEIIELSFDAHEGLPPSWDRSVMSEPLESAEDTEIQDQVASDFLGLVALGQTQPDKVADRQTSQMLGDEMDEFGAQEIKSDILTPNGSLNVQEAKALNRIAHLLPQFI